MVESGFNSINAEKAWEAAMGQMKMTMDRQMFATLLGDARLVSYTADTFTVAVKNTFARDWLEQRLTDNLVNILTPQMGGVQNVQFTVSATDTNSAAAFSHFERPIEKKIGKTNRTINIRYTFENLVVGAHNQLAAAACKAVSAMPGTAYNPLFLYSGVGLGKTHLLNAIGNALFKREDLNILYVSGEEFTNDFIQSIQRGENVAFREKYRTADILLIDDIQFIIGKESTQEEFFHTFNTLYNMDKQIVLTSDRPPKAMSTLDDRMRSRFECGLTVDIQAPDLETRSAILRAKSQRMAKNVPEIVLDLIARSVQTNVRELEGALNRVLATSELCGRNLDRDLVLMALADIVPAQQGLKTEDLIDQVSQAYGVDSARIHARDRTAKVALCRQVIMYLLREEENYSLPQIGQILGGRDHSTIMHGCEKISHLLDTDNRFRGRFSQICEQLYGKTMLSIS